MKARKSNYWTVVLWFPYFIVYTIASLFLSTYGGDIPTPAAGLLAITALLFYPLYILIINSYV
jgi:bacteriorhodopsin